MVSRSHAGCEPWASEIGGSRHVRAVAERSCCAGASGEITDGELVLKFLHGGAVVLTFAYWFDAVSG